jgi:hypothetical protein
MRLVLDIQVVESPGSTDAILNCAGSLALLLPALLRSVGISGRIL